MSKNCVPAGYEEPLPYDDDYDYDEEDEELNSIVYPFQFSDANKASHSVLSDVTGVLESSQTKSDLVKSDGVMKDSQPDSDFWDCTGPSETNHNKFSDAVNNQVDWDDISPAKDDWDPVKNSTSFLTTSQKNKDSSPSTSPILFFLEDIRIAIINNNLKFIQSQIEAKEGFTIDTPIKGLTALMVACEYGRPDIVQYCISQGADVNLITDKLTPLMYTCSSYYGKEQKLISCAKCLIEAKAVLDTQDKYGMSALMFACGSGKRELAKLLIDNNAEVNICDEKAWTPLHYAASRGDGLLARYLMDNGATLESTSIGLFPGDVAIERGHDEVGSLLEQIRTHEAYENIRDKLAEAKSDKKKRAAVPTASFLSDLEILLGDLDLSEYNSVFAENNLSLRDLLLFEASDFEKLNIPYGVQLKLADAIKISHTQRLKVTGLPLVTRKLHINCFEANEMMKNISKHLLYLDCTISYLRKCVKVDPETLERENQFESPKNLLQETNESILNCLKLQENLISCKKELAPLCKGERFQKNDLIHKKSFKNLFITPTKFCLFFIGLVGAGTVLIKYRSSLPNIRGIFKLK